MIQPIRVCSKFCKTLTIHPIPKGTLWHVVCVHSHFYQVKINYCTWNCSVLIL